MQGLAAVMPAADADASEIQHGGNVVGVDTIDEKGGKGSPSRLLLRSGAKNAQPLDAVELLEEMAGELRFPGCDLVEPQMLQIGDRSAHAHSFANRGGASLELVRQSSPGAVIKKYILDHFASPQERRHGFKQVFPCPEKAHTGGSAQLVGGPHKKINPQPTHIGGLVSQALAGIHEHQCSHVMRQGRDLLHGVAAAKGVADVHQAHQTGALVELLTQIVEIELSALGDAHVTQHATRALSELLPGHEIAVVLHHAEQHLITDLKVGVSPGACHQIDGLGGIAGKHHFIRAGCPHKSGGRSTGSLESLGGAGTELMRPPVHIGVVTAVVAAQSVKHRPGLLAGSRVIEIDQGTTLSVQLIQNRKISTSPFRKSHACVTRKCGHRGRAGSLTAEDVSHGAAAAGRRSTTSQQ